jgi:hypothetical protein
MRFLTVYYESKYNDAYFSEKLRSIARAFNISSLKLNRIEDASKLTLGSSPTWPRLVLVHKYIKPYHGETPRLDGISMKRNGLAIVRYQNSLQRTLYVLMHELGHLLNLGHCDSHRCVMGVYVADGKVSYAWWQFTDRRRISKNLFCESCASMLNH